MYTDRIMFLVFLGIALFFVLSGIVGIKRGDISILGKERDRVIWKKITGPGAYIFSLIFTILGGAMLAGLVYETIECGFLIAC